MPFPAAAGRTRWTSTARPASPSAGKGCWSPPLKSSTPGGRYRGAERCSVAQQRGARRSCRPPRRRIVKVPTCWPVKPLGAREPFPGTWHCGPNDRQPGGMAAGSSSGNPSIPQRYQGTRRVGPAPPGACLGYSYPAWWKGTGRPPAPRLAPPRPATPPRFFADNPNAVVSVCPGGRGRCGGTRKEENEGGTEGRREGPSAA